MRLKTARTPRRWRSARTDLASVAGGEGGEAGVGEAHHLEAAQRVRLARQAGLADRGLLVDDLADAGEEPRVVAGDGVDLVVGEAVAHGLGGEAQAVGGLRARAP